MIVTCGCFPDLTREVGAIHLVTIGLPAEATAIRATIEAAEAVSQDEAPLATSGGRLDFDGVPAGSAKLTVQALGMGVTSERTVVVSVMPAATASITVDFAAPPAGTDGGINLTSRNFGPTPAVARADADAVDEAVLVASTADVEPALRDQLDAVQRALGAPIRGLRLERAQLTLNPSTSVGVQTLATLWSGPVEVSLVSADGLSRVRVAAGSVSNTQAVLVGLPGQTGLTDFVARGLTVEITGPTSLDEEMPFSAELGVLLYWVASSD